MSSRSLPQALKNKRRVRKDKKRDIQVEESEIVSDLEAWVLEQGDAVEIEDLDADLLRDLMIVHRTNRALAGRIMYVEGGTIRFGGAE